MNTAELELHLAATQAFILADAEDVNFRRRTRTSDGAGGFVDNTEVLLATQTVRLIPQSDKVTEVIGADGRRAVPEWIIMTMPGTDMNRYDRFTWRGIIWEIAQIHYKPDYEIKGDVIRYA